MISCGHKNYFLSKIVWCILVTGVLLNYSFAQQVVTPRSIPTESTLPNVYIPTKPKKSRSPYPWKRDIVATVFWVGEKPTFMNPTPNRKSSWDINWQQNYGGYDNPNDRTKYYTPKGFTPRLNPFYVALPYNDVAPGNKTKPEAYRVIPWFKKKFKRPGRTVLKSKWIAIKHAGKVCFAQWEDCGPFNTDDWRYVFGNEKPKNFQNNGAAIDISPAVRDYLGLKSGEKCDWRFVDLKEIRPGPWMVYGTNNEFVQRRKNKTITPQRMDELKRKRDEWYKNQPLPWK